VGKLRAVLNLPAGRQEAYNLNGAFVFAILNSRLGKPAAFYVLNHSYSMPEKFHRLL
jgi:hypothetical protein